MSDDLALYIHWPFCLSKCPYCDFNSHVREQISQDAWRKALLLELDHTAQMLGKRRITSVFFGGGTPSLMPPDTVAALLDKMHAQWDVAEDVEITLEANPTSSEIAKFKAFAKAGVNRVSLGVQSLNQDTLSFLGREHSATEALDAVKMAADSFPRYSFDLIYAHPKQSTAAWEKELKAALPHAGDHLSLYQLTIEPGTAFFHAHGRGDLKEIDENAAAELFQLTQEVLEAEGLPAYEISNHARAGGESRHNLTYWRYGDYAGIGPGAHGRISVNGKRFATFNTRSPEKWLEQTQAQQHGQESKTLLSAEEQTEERLLMGLRLREGISHETFQAATGKALVDVLDAKALEKYTQAGMVEDDGTHVRITPKGMLLLNYLLGELISS